MPSKTQCNTTSRLAHSFGLILLAASITPFVTGCGSTAIVSRKHALPIEGRIASSDTTTVFLYGANTGNRTTIAREEITDIDHPGNVAATFGAVLTGYGIANIYVSAPQCDQKGAAFCTGVFLPAAAGVSLLGYGLAVWLRSVDASLPKSDELAARATVIPMVSMDKTNQVVGASAKISF